MKQSWDATREVTLPDGSPAVGPRVGRIIEVLAANLVPDGGDMPIPIHETRAHVFLARYLRDQDPGSRNGLKAMLVLFDLAPFLFIGRFQRFINLTPSEQDLYLKDWEASRIYHRRMVVVLLKTIVGMGYYNDPRVLKAIGFKIPCESKGGGK